MRKIIFIQILFISALVSTVVAGEVTIVHYMQPASNLDGRQSFVQEIIAASLEYTEETDGPYKMVPTMTMNYDRAEIMQARYPNPVARISGTRQRQKKWLVIPIPINRGIVGYRVFLINRARQSDFAKISTLADLIKMELKAGQNFRWSDVEILRENGIEVVTGTNYEGLFEMLALNRFDFFPRGINEAFSELAARRDKYPDMIVEEKIALYYPLPRVLATTRGNTKLANRVERGLKTIFKNGVHRRIWLKHNQKWVNMANLRKRKIITLKNTYARPDLPYDQKEYWYQIGE